MTSKLLNEFYVRILLPQDIYNELHNGGELDVLCQNIKQALDQIQFGAIIRQKFDERQLSGLIVEIGEERNETE